MAIHDEVAVFLPAMGDASPTLILDRTRHAFTEVAAVRRMCPLLAALHLRHLDVFGRRGAPRVGAGGSPLRPGGALRLIDAWGARLRHHGLARPPGGAGARPGRGAGGGGRAGALRRDAAGRPPPGRTWLTQDFGLPPSLSAGLTDHERDVVLLTLQGYPMANAHGPPGRVRRRRPGWRPGRDAPVPEGETRTSKDRPEHQAG